MSGFRSRPLGLRLVPLVLGFALTPLAGRPAGAADEIVLTTTGAPLKIVVRDETAIYEEPNKSSTSKTARPFEYYYVLPPEKGVLRVDPAKPDEALKNGFFRISTSTKESGTVGWISRDNVVVWPHRQALGLKPIAGRKPALFYKSKEDLKQAYLGGAQPAVMSKEPSSGAGLSLMPLLDEFSMKNSSGDEVKGYRVGYLHQLARAGGGAGAAGAKVNLGASTLDVVFVIDTTASMQPYINSTKEVVRDLARRLANDPSQSVPVRLGLVAYRDRINADVPGWYLNKVFWDLNRTAETATDSPGKGTNLDEFLAVLETVTAATTGSEDTPEDVLGGLREAVRLPSWNPNAFKHVVLIGDASGHVDGDDPKNAEKLTIEGIKAMMQPAGLENVNAKVLCHAIRIEGENPEDYPRAEEHFSKLAEGVGYPGLYATIKKGDNANFVDKLVGLINDSRSNLNKVVNPAGGAPAVGAPAAGAPAAGAPAGLSDVPGLNLLLEMVAASAPGEGKVPSFASGFTATIDLDGKEQVEPYLLVQFGQLSSFRATLSFAVNVVKGAGDPGNRDVEKIVSDMQNACSSLSMAEPIKRDLPLEVVFSYLLGFPVKSDIFKVTPQVLANMTQEDFDQWTKKVEACDSILRGYIESPKLWKSLGRNIKPDERQGFIRISELP